MDREADVRKFSNSRSKEEARVLNDLALSFINRRSASAESFTSLHPFVMKDSAFSAVTVDVGVAAMPSISRRWCQEQVDDVVEDDASVICMSYSACLLFWLEI